MKKILKIKKKNRIHLIALNLLNNLLVKKALNLKTNLLIQFKRKKSNLNRLKAFLIKYLIKTIPILIKKLFLNSTLVLLINPPVVQLK